MLLEGFVFRNDSDCLFNSLHSRSAEAEPMFGRKTAAKRQQLLNTIQGVQNQVANMQPLDTGDGKKAR